MRKSILCSIFMLLVLFVSSSFAADLKIQYRDGDHGNATDNHIKPHLNIINQGSDTAVMSELTIRYYYSKEGTAGEVFYVDYASIGAGCITGTFHNGYLEIGFAGSTGNIPGYGNSGEIQIRFHKEDWSNYNEAGDYSYNSAAVSYTDWDNITLYQNGILVWGMEQVDGACPPQTPEPTPQIPADAVFVESGGIVVMEAEHYSTHVQGTGLAAGSSWEETFSMPDSSNGDALKAVPNKGINVQDTTDGPRLDYNVQFETTGTYYLWVRMWGPSAYDDSLHAGLDGEPASFGKSGLSMTSFSWKWVNMAKTRVTVDVETAGLHTVHIWMREDGTRLDKILLTKDPGYIPWRQGPAESPLEAPSPTPTPASETPAPTPVTCAGIVQITPAEIITSPGESFTVEIHINSGNQIISAYQFSLAYDAAVLMVDTESGTDGVEAGPDGFVAAVNAQTPGSLVFNGFDTAGTGPGADLNFVTIYFKALALGDSPLSLTIDSLVDENTNSVGMFFISDGTVIVNDELQTPEPTPTPVITDLPTASPVTTPDPVTPTPTSTDGIGDVNNDGAIDIIDALLCAQYYVGLSPSNFDTGIADVNTDGEITIIDALYLAQYYVGLINGLPVPEPTPGDPTPVPQEGAGSVWISPATQTVSTGSEFTTEVHVNTGSQSLAAFGIEIHYNSQYISVNTVTEMNGVSSGAAGIGISSVNSSTSGEIAISGLDAYGIDPGTDLHLFTVHWTAGNENGTSSLGIVINDLVDAGASVIGIPGGTGGSVAVTGAEVTPTPTPIPENYPDVGDVWFLPVKQVVTEDEDVLVEVRLNSGTQKIAAYGLDITYDSAILTIDDVEPGPDGFIAAVSYSSPGIIRVSGFDTSGTGPGSNLHLLNVFFNAHASGTSPLNLTVTSLADANTTDIGTAHGIPGEIIVMPVTPGISCKAQYLCGEQGVLTTMIRPYLNIINNGTEDVALSDVTLRYYYSKDGAADEVFYMDHADIGTSFVTGTIFPDYLEIGFTEEAGVLQPLEETGQIICGVGRTDADPYEQTYDYSFDPSYTTYADYRKVALYVEDALVWGSEPAFPPVANPSPTPTPTVTPESTPVLTSPPTNTPVPTNEPVAGAGDVWIIPANTTVDEGAHFETEIHINAGNQEIAAYGFEIDFDEEVIQVDIEQGAEGVSAEPDGYVSVVNPDIPGRLIFAGYDTSGKAVGTDINFVKVHWVAVGPGTSPLDLTIESLIDLVYNTVGTPNPIGGQVTVIATTPTPDPTPTPEPTEYPGPVEGAGNVWFSPSSQTVNTGDTFTTEIHVNSGYQDIASFSFIIAFDPDIIKVDTSLGNNGAEAGPDGFVSIVNPDTPGILRMTGIDNGSGPGTDLHFHTIHWIAIGEGTTQLDLTIEDLGDNDYNAVGTPNGIDGSVQVTGSGQTSAGDVWIVPDYRLVGPSEECRIDIYLNTGDQVLGAYSLDIEYNEEVIGVNTAIGTYGVEAGADGFVSAVNPTNPGLLIVAGFSVQGTGPGQNLHLATVYFTALQGGTSPLTIIVNTLVDLDTNTIGSPNGTGGTIQVTGPGDTPEPTPEETTAPTILPSPTPTVQPTATPSTGKDPGTVWVVPEIQQVSFNGDFTTEIHVNTGTQLLAAYGIDILYDSSVIAVRTTIGTSGVEAGPDGFVTAVNAQTPGIIRTSGFDIAGTGPGSDLHIMTVYWTTVSEGTSPLSIDVKTLSDLNADTIGMPNGIGGTISVTSSAETPEPTPEETAVPTILPSAAPTVEPTPEPTATASTGGNPGTVWIVPQNRTVARDTPFTMEIHADSGTQMLAAYGITIFYDDAIIQLSNGLSSIKEGPDGFISALNNNTNGCLVITGFDVSGTGPGSDLHIITVDWISLENPGTTSLILEVNDFVDVNTMDIGTPYGLDGTVTVTI
ncbi:MAG: hypothetical protein JXB88_09865 [Spirochaetales bacterium]|nr:hypothetical protein [Spirochaetales bacterium]